MEACVKKLQESIKGQLFLLSQRIAKYLAANKSILSSSISSFYRDA
jgi:hypothetical protein